MPENGERVCGGERERKEERGKIGDGWETENSGLHSLSGVATTVSMYCEVSGRDRGPRRPAGLYPAGTWPCARSIRIITVFVLPKRYLLGTA